jgi:hypothetical protein
MTQGRRSNFASPHVKTLPDKSPSHKNTFTGLLRTSHRIDFAPLPVLSSASEAYPGRHHLAHKSTSQLLSLGTLNHKADWNVRQAHCW